MSGWLDDHMSGRSSALPKAGCLSVF